MLKKTINVIKVLKIKKQTGDVVPHLTGMFSILQSSNLTRFIRLCKKMDRLVKWVLNSTVFITGKKRHASMFFIFPGFPSYIPIHETPANNFSHKTTENKNSSHQFHHKHTPHSLLITTPDSWDKDTQLFILLSYMKPLVKLCFQPSPVLS